MAALQNFLEWLKKFCNGLVYIVHVSMCLIFAVIAAAATPHHFRTTTILLLLHMYGITPLISYLHSQNLYFPQHLGHNFGSPHTPLPLFFLIFIVLLGLCSFV